MVRKKFKKAEMYAMNNRLLAMLQTKLFKHVKADEHILHIVRLFHEQEPLEYLRGLAHYYEMH